jgi:hypothetical protein
MSCRSRRASWTGSRLQEWSEGLHSINHIGGLCLPLMILQKMHAAAMLGGMRDEVLLGLVVCD